TREGLRNGGETGPAVVPGSPNKSLLLAAIKHSNPERAMPPKKKLPAEVIADFERWISMGAPDPRDGDGRIAGKPSKYEIDIEKGRKFWSFQAVTKVVPPTVKDAGWPKSDIDRYVLGAMEAKDLHPVADADPRTLIRRLYFDLIGLPPNPEQIDTFV